MKKILIVDDSYAARLFISKMLETCDFDISFAENGVDALEQITLIKPDLMIVDLLMPEMGGMELLRRLKVESYSLMTIVLSADIQEYTKKKCFELGASAFIQKPVRQEELIDSIHKLISAK